MKCRLNVYEKLKKKKKKKKIYIYLKMSSAAFVIGALWLMVQLDTYFAAGIAKTF